MWKEYSKSYIKNNRASGISVMAAAFISALLLSLLCSLFYNLWTYEIARIKAEEGDWQARVTGELGAQQLERIQSYANVERAVVNPELSEGPQTTVDICFKNVRSILSDMPRIAELAGLPAEAVSYHYSLLNLYLVRDSNDTALRWIFPFFLAVTAMACVSLILVIHNAFEVTMNARIRQFGIFSSIGATPGQIRLCLLQEAFTLCALPVAAGGLIGILASMGMIEGMNRMLSDVAGRLSLPFAYHPLVLLLSLLTAVVTVWVSAWIPARDLSRLTPLEALRNTGELQLKRRKNSRLLSRLFGIEGELAGNALRAQRKAMRTGTLSLVFSFLAFSLMMCCLTIAAVSQRETYFERYQDAWDVMAELKNTEIGTVGEAAALRALSGVQSSTVYQKAEARRVVTPDEISGELQAIGGFSDAPAQYVSAVEGGWLVNAPLVILDDESFLDYCRQLGVEPRLDGAILLNQTRDAADPNFRKRRILPYLTGTHSVTVLQAASPDAASAELPVTAYAMEVPKLREEYGTLDFYELVHFLPASLWDTIKPVLGGQEEDTYIRILAQNEASLEDLNKIEDSLRQLLGKKYEMKLENRIQDRLDNEKMISGMMAIFSVFCILLAVIGIANIFSNALGFIRQRRREFARYLSIGLTPAGIKKIFCLEALIIAGRPVLITLPVTVLTAALFIKISYLEPGLFLRDAPFIPILAFILAIFAFVSLAYWLGARKVLKASLAEVLRDDTML